MTNIALFDMDGTLCDYDGAIIRDLNKIKNEEYGDITSLQSINLLSREYREKMRLIRKVPGWWKNLEPIISGLQLFSLAKEIGFKNSVLTKGPAHNPMAWAEKVEWCKEHLPSGVDIHISDDKSAVYGRVLVDDWPPYVKNWLIHRPRGLVIMPAHHYNENVSHPQIIRYDGSAVSYKLVVEKLKEVYEKG